MIRLEMNRKQEAILAAIVVFGALAAFLLLSGILRPPAQAPSAEAEPAPPSLLETVNKAMSYYDEIDQIHIDALDSGRYQLENPLIAVDPYGTAPLSALVMFQTKEPVRITVNVAGRTAGVSLEHTFGGFETSHFIPVYGLYPGAATLVQITAEPLDALDGHDNYETQQAQFLIEADELPDSFPDDIITQIPHNFVSAEPPFFFTHIRKSAFDINGDYRWCYRGFDTRYPTKYTDYETMLIITGSFDDGDALLLEVSMLGRIISAAPVDRSYDMEGFSSGSFMERRTLYPLY